MHTQKENKAGKTTVSVSSEVGTFTIDLGEVDRVQELIKSRKVKPDTRTLFSKILEQHVGEKYEQSSRYWRPQLGRLIKYYSSEFLASEWTIEDEFHLKKDRRVPVVVQSLSFPGGIENECLELGIRLLRHNVTGEGCLLSYSVDDDGDSRITVYMVKGDKETTSLFETRGRRCGQFLKELVNRFFEEGPLKGEFFDIDYNFIERDHGIDAKIAWSSEVKEQLQLNVLDFVRAMPKLEAMGLNTSRGMILAGPPGTGKTMIGKWLAANTTMTCVLISAEMIRSRGNIATVYKQARLMAPTLIIVEDIDTTGGLDRRAADHPLLGEFLQCMDGMVTNKGVITVATTNHASSIDPAIADRPGRFDRVIEVGLPNTSHRQRILSTMLASLPTQPCVNEASIQSIAKRAEGLSGAWVAEIVQFAMISAFSRGLERVTVGLLEQSVKDVLVRQGLAYNLNTLAETSSASREKGHGVLFG